MSERENRNLTIDNMEIFIRNSQDDIRDLQTRLDEFNSVKELAKSQASKYAYIKAWFLKTYGKEYNKYAEEMDNSEDESIAS